MVNKHKNPFSALQIIREIHTEVAIKKILFIFLRLTVKIDNKKLWRGCKGTCIIIYCHQSKNWESPFKRQLLMSTKCYK